MNSVTVIRSGGLLISLRSVILTILSLDAQYHFEQCPQEVAEVELYRITDAPLTLRNHRNVEYLNSNAKVRHAHRRSFPELDSPPNHGCSSKMAQGLLIAHNRWALEDARPYGSRTPSISYGSIYQYWRRTSQHPSFPGHEHNLVSATGNYPDDPIFMYGYGKYPPGHPGNTIGLPGSYAGNSGRPKPSSSGNSKKLPPRARRNYAHVPQMKPHDQIPLPSQAAQASAVKRYKKLQEASPKLVSKFAHYFYAWRETWYNSTTVPSSS